MFGVTCPWLYCCDPVQVYDEDSKRFILLHGSHPSAKQHEVRDVLSGAQLLYRASCLFPGIYILEEDQNSNCSVEFEHKDTGEALSFSKWNDEAQVRVSKPEVPGWFEQEVLELLYVLWSAKCPYPYDGTLPGPV